ncbi:MAG: hypothetical protein AAF657_30550 [Acidobacteriota bacterium]
MATRSPNTTAIPATEAWALLREWHSNESTVSLLYSRGNSQALLTLRGRLVTASAERLEIRGPSALLTANLQKAEYELGPVAMFHPSLGLEDSQDGLHVWTPEGDWLFLAVAGQPLLDGGDKLAAVNNGEEP